jgi:hypothetical protein
MSWLLLILSLPTENATARMRAWRALKASGAAVLRDGVYVMPDRESCRTEFEAVCAEVRGSGGSAHLIRAADAGAADYRSLFDRSEQYAELLRPIAAARASLSAGTSGETLKRARKWRRSLTAICDIDFFPGEVQRQVVAALDDLEQAVIRAQTPDEPRAVQGTIKELRLADFQGRTWVTRSRPWVDRLACAWLIRRFIDRRASFQWLKDPARRPRNSIGFDFDGARFSHVGARVTFEVLQASFGLQRPALDRIGGLVHYLDVGGIQPDEADGVESVLSGLRAANEDDDRLFKTASLVFDGLLAHFESQEAAA